MPEVILSIEDISKLNNFATSFSRMGDKYLCCRLGTGMEPIPLLKSPLRLHGLTIVLCRKGSLDVEVNLTPYHLTSGMLVVISPDQLLQLRNLDYSILDVSLLFVDAEFMLDVNFDLNAINVKSLIENRSPILKLQPEEVEIFNKHLELLEIHALNDSHTIFSRNIARSMIAATSYRLLQFHFDRINDIETEPSPSGRRANYVHEFMRLVHLDYTRHRSVSYYASKLFISPKYLSLIIKENTGRSAAEWINEFVILEAKNLLRFSGKNIQQVAYALNFSNQSSFGKYFKHLTGQSPSQYQKS